MLTLPGLQQWEATTVCPICATTSDAAATTPPPHSTPATLPPSWAQWPPLGHLSLPRGVAVSVCRWPWQQQWWRTLALCVTCQLTARCIYGRRIRYSSWRMLTWWVDPFVFGDRNVLGIVMTMGTAFSVGVFLFFFFFLLCLVLLCLMLLSASFFNSHHVLVWFLCICLSAFVSLSFISFSTSLCLPLCLALSILFRRS